MIAYNTSIVRDGLVLHLDAANVKSYPGIGTTWADLSGNGNHAEVANGPSYSSDNKGILSLDGIDDYAIDTQTSNLPIGNSNRTICVWFKPYNEVHNLVQLGTGGAGTGNQVYIVEYYRLNSITYLYTDGINSGNNLQITGDQIPSLNEWNYVVFGNTGQNYFYYLNGVLKKSGVWSIPINTVGQQYVIGKRLDVDVATSFSDISSVKIYDRSLTELEIRQNFEALRGRYGI